MDKKPKYIVGIDEVGRGPIAGPVAVGAFMCTSDFFDTIEIKTPLRDSKKLSKKQREEWYEYLKAEQKRGNCDFSIAYVSAEMIDKFGIVKCIQKALDISLSKIVPQKNQNLSALPSLRGLRHDSDFDSFAALKIFLDGGLKAPEQYTNQETVIRGDQLHPVISCASIVAKVSRDKVMTMHGAEYKEYGFEKHSGYGTKAHYEAIKKHGLTPLHRKSFLTKIAQK